MRGNTEQTGRAWRDKAFGRGLAQLKTFVATEGHARVHARYVTHGGFRLGTWVWLRRQMYRRGQLSPAHTQILAALPGWSWDPNEDRLRAGLRALQAFSGREGHTRVPLGHCEGGFPLSRWLERLRWQVRRGECDARHERLLRAIPGWTLLSPQQERCEETFRQRLRVLRRMAQERGTGRARAETYANKEERLLAKWACGLRMQYRAGVLKSSWIAALEAIPGWTWGPLDASWARGLAATRRFGDREGHLRVPGDHLERGVHLRAWISEQRVAYRSGRLPRERTRALESVPQWSWRPSADKWPRGVAALRVFVAREGHARVPQRHVEGGLRLGVWVATVRRRRRQGRLSAAQIAEVGSVPGVWCARTVGRSRARR